MQIRPVTKENLEDLCDLCVSPEKRESQAFMKGIEGKKKWGIRMLNEWGAFAMLAYEGSSAVGMIQYEPIPEESVVRIRCIYVPQKQHWRKGIATQLLSSLEKDMKERKDWFGGRPALGLVTKTFAGEQSGQYPARLFFTRKGFRQVGADPDLLFYPLKEGFAYLPREVKEAAYVPQEEDRGRVVILYAPSFCPFSYVFLKKAEELIRGIAPEVEVRWIDKSEEHEFNRRGSIEGCVVNGKPIRSFVLLKEEFQKEVTEALKS